MSTTRPGDEVAQIEPGTPFTALPDHWRCPVCDAEKRQFMALGESETRAHAGHPADPDALRIAALTQAYREADGRMRGLPVHNPALSVEAVGFGRVPGGVVGAVVTPWCLNIVFLPDGAAAAGGATVSRGFPSGPLEMMGGELQGFGPLETCSLFSPMDEFAEQEAARLAAQGAMDELMTPLPRPSRRLCPRRAGDRSSPRPSPRGGPEPCPRAASPSRSRSIAGQWRRARCAPPVPWGSPGRCRD